MARPRSSHPTDAELEILQVLWRTGPASLGSIHREVCKGREVAKTTTATTLKVMLQKAWVRREQRPRGYLWSAAVTREDTATHMVGKLIARVFDGSAQRMVAHLVEAGRITEKELQDLQRLVRQPRKSGKRNNP